MVAGRGSSPTSLVYCRPPSWLIYYRQQVDLLGRWLQAVEQRHIFKYGLAITIFIFIAYVLVGGQQIINRSEYIM
jgi:hypothetical protein